MDFLFIHPMPDHFLNLKKSASSKEMPFKLYWNRILFSIVKKSKRYTLIIGQLLYLNHYIILPKKELTSTIIYLLRRAGALLKNNTQDNEIKILYPFDKQTETTLQHYFKDISFTHYSQILYDLSTPVTK